MRITLLQATQMTRLLGYEVGYANAKQNFLPRKIGILPYMDHRIITRRVDAEAEVDEARRGSVVDHTST